MLSRVTVIRCCYLVAFLDLFAVGMFYPLFNRRGRHLGASPSVLGLIGSIYGGLQFFSSPYMGKASDTWGRKPILLLSFLGCIAGYLTMGVTDTIFFFALARLPTGILKHSQSSARAYLSDITRPEERAGMMGTFNALGSMGFIVGPVIGGIVAVQDNGFFKVSLLTCTVYLGAFLFVWFVFDNSIVKKIEVSSAVKESQETHEIIDKSNRNTPVAEPDKDHDDLKKHKASDVISTKKDTNDNTKEEQAGISRFFSFLKIKSVQNVMDLFLIRFVIALGMMTYRSNYTAMLDYRYGVDAKTAGYIISFGSIIGALSGMSVGTIYNYFGSDAKMMFSAGLLMVTGLFGIAISPSIHGILVCVAPLSLATALMRVNSHNLTLKRCRADEKGAVMGVGNSLISIARMLSPAIAGFAQEISVVGPCWISVVITMIGVGLMVAFPLDKPITDKTKKQD